MEARPQALMDFCCSRDAISIAEGQPEAAIHDRTAYLAAFVDYLKTLSAPCSLTPAGAVVTSGNLAASFVNMKCKAAAAGVPDVTARILFVWRRVGGQWKIIREMYAAGSM